jgi:hypothetical protein
MVSRIGDVDVIGSYACPLVLLIGLRTAHMVIVWVEKVGWIQLLLLQHALVPLIDHFDVLDGALLI